MRFSIIGTGASGTLMSVILKSSGHVVHAQDKDVNKVAILKEMPEWKATGKTEATGKPDLVTSDAAECIEGTDYIMVCTTTDAHAEVAEAIAGSVRPEQTVILNPGHVGGVLNFRTALIGAGCRTLPRICEAADMMFACRTVEIGHTFHSGVKNRILLASITSGTAADVAEELKDVFPCYVPAESTLVEAADAERIAVCNALGVNVEPLLPHLKSVYNLQPDNLYDAIQSCAPYKGIKSPMSTNHRFMQEDTLCDLVPTASIGHMLGIDTPVIDMIIGLESLMLGKDFMTEGRTVQKLGLAGKSVGEIHDMVR